MSNPYNTAATRRLSPYLYAALASPYGIGLRTTNISRLISALAHLRRAIADPALAELSFRRAPPPFNPEAELWIVRQAQTDSNPMPAPLEL